MQEARDALGARGEGDMGDPGDAAQAGTRAVKVVLVGDGGCGKTSLLMVFAAGAFPEVSTAPQISLPWVGVVRPDATPCQQHHPG